jgi:hypothetical protein
MEYMTPRAVTKVLTFVVATSLFVLSLETQDLLVQTVTAIASGLIFGTMLREEVHG